jgi:phosphate:Na+ symporter
MAQQMVSMARSFASIYEKKAELSPDSYRVIEDMASPCRENIEYLINAFPQMPEDVDRNMRSNDELLRWTLNWNYKTYLIRLAAKSTTGGTFSEIIFSFERIGSIIRELRKTSISMGTPASALNVPDLIKPPHLDEGVQDDEESKDFL